MTSKPRAALPLLHRATAGILFGAQVVVAMAVVPASRGLTGPQYVLVHTRFTRSADAFLPLLGGTTTLISYLRYRRHGRVADLAATGALVAAGMAGAHNLAINARVADLDPERLGETGADARWLSAARARWARLHRVRLAGGAVAFAAAHTDGGRPVRIGRPSGPGRAAPLDPLAALVAAVVARDAVTHLRALRREPRPATGITAPPGGSAPANTQTGQVERRERP
jgi:hypothetical protein